MPIPQHSTALPSIQLAQVPDYDGLTEVRVHGVGGTPPDALLEDMSPEQVSGDSVAGFYRTSDHREPTSGDGVSRHVECYSWGGLTSGTKTRVLWLALLPFLLGNLAGWMCSATTRSSPVRFGFHRAALGLGALALTVNTALLAAGIGLDVLSYQSVRAGLSAHQWWLAPLTWPTIAGHPARQLIVGTVVIEVLLAALIVIARRSWRYEAVRPPSTADAPRDKPRLVTAAALDDGLANADFWDGGHSVRQFTWIHVAAFTGYLAIVLGVTAHALPGAAGPGALWTIAITAAAAAEALAVGYVCLDAAGALTEWQRRWPFWIFIVSAAGLVCAGVYAWLRPGALAGAAALPSMAGITAATVGALAVPVLLTAVSVLAGGRARGTMAGGPLVALLLGLSLLNGVVLAVQIWVAHLVGPVTGDAAAAAGKIYLPVGLSSGVPLQAWAAVAAVAGFLAVEAVRWLLTSHLPPGVLAGYLRQAVAHQQAQPRRLRPWYTPPEPDPGWERSIARTRLIAGLAPEAGWLLWAIVAAQIAAALSAWLLRWQMPVVMRDAGVTIAGLVLPALMGVLYAAWSNPVQRRQICTLWDVGTFWPRSYHPLAPPSYSERAIPELQRRLWWLHDNGGRVLLVSHSQGTVLAVAALAQTGCRPAGDHPLLVTFGSPLRKLYHWAFPAYITPGLLTPLAPDGDGHVHDWRNFSYPTDPIGGPLSEMITPPGGARVDDVLPDPAECWHVYGQPAPSPGGHSGYWSDRRVWREINRMASERLRTPPQAPGVVN